jgi:hypothetical protein
MNGGALGYYLPCQSKGGGKPRPFIAILIGEDLIDLKSKKSLPHLFISSFVLFGRCGLRPPLSFGLTRRSVLRTAACSRALRPANANTAAKLPCFNG